MTQRGLLTTIGAATLGVGLMLGGATAIPAALAQQTTPAASAPSSTTAQTPAQPASDRDAQQAQAYDQFVASLARELDDDESAVDVAIRTTLKQQVDARQTAGDIDKVHAAAMKAAIDASDAPLFLGLGGPGGMHGFGPGGHESERGPRGGDQPAPAQPGPDQPANQSGAGAAPAASDAAV